MSSCLAHSGFENLVVLCASGAGKVLIIPASVYVGAVRGVGLFPELVLLLLLKMSTAMLFTCLTL